MASDTERPGDARVTLSRGREAAAIAFLVVVLLAAGAAALTRSALFHAKTIRVHGLAHVSRADVLRLAAIGPNSNVFTLDAGAAERRLEREPWIADATVTKDLPSTVSIRVRERVPVAVASSDGVLRLVADDGTLLDVALPSLAAGLTRIEPADEDAPEPTVRAIGGAARAIAAMTAAVRHAVSFVSILADGQLRIDLSTGADVAYGPASEPVEKAQALRALLDWAADVRVPSAPTAELVAGGSITP